MHDYRSMDLDPKTRAMLDYASKLTVHPDSMEESDVESLREAGLSEQEILSTTLITCLFAFMTRLTSGLGVEHKPGRLEQMDRWLTGPARDSDWLMGRKT
ncbi:MAG: hypothetical protein IIB27_09345 [Chloroflexi bacterium]|nr:hypothetical protein [Chloroflexota bacterium]